MFSQIFFSRLTYGSIYMQAPMYIPIKQNKNQKIEIMSAYSPQAVGGPCREMCMGGTHHSPARIQHSYFGLVGSKL